LKRERITDFFKLFVFILYCTSGGVLTLAGQGLSWSAAQWGIVAFGEEIWTHWRDAVFYLFSLFRFYNKPWE
jgi:hypothetical protein